MNFSEISPYLSNKGYQKTESVDNKSPSSAPSSVSGTFAEEESRGDIPAVQALGQEGLQKSDKDGNGKSGNGRKNFDSYECETCKNRKYQDGSNDPGVSFKTPTKLSPEKAATAVRSHENEHVVRERAAAKREDRKVVSQSVTYHSAICPECGQVYVSGGTTRTVTKGQVDETYSQAEEEKGKYLDVTA